MDKFNGYALTDSDTALIFEVQRFSTEDGPGIRTTVFFKGCPLECAWCHNPESISGKPEIHWLAARCIGCHTCLDVCPTKALSFSAQGLQIDRDRCDPCGLCAAECPSTALEQIGKTWTLSALVDEAVKDKTYYETSGGGVTVSGGEPARQADFTATFLKQLKKRDVHTAFDTCGLCQRRALDKILPYTDLVLFDIKLIDLDAHIAFTGSDNRLILDNFEYIARRLGNDDTSSRLWVRTPIIPGATDNTGNITAIGRLIAATGSGVVSRWELCAFNRLCTDKYQRLGRDWTFAGLPNLTAGAMDTLAETARASGVEADIVCWSGTTGSPPDTDRRKEQICVFTLTSQP